MTDYGELAKDLISEYFPQFGSFRRSVLYIHYEDSTYDTSNRTVSKGTPLQETLYVMFTQMKDSLVDDVVRSTDSIVLIPSKDISRSPRINDVIVDSDNVKWKVLVRGKDPKPVLYSVPVRPISGDVL